MRLALSLVVLWVVLPGLTLPLSGRAISQSVYDNLVFYFKYASSAYSDSCANPNGNTLVEKFFESSTDTQGFVARDDRRKEVVVSFRGSSSIADFFTDVDVLFTDYNSTGVTAPVGTRVHSGFLNGYNSVSNSIISLVGEQLKAHPDYTIVTTGHSLGGALSSLAATSLRGNFPSAKVTMYTYGQPRTGNNVYASWINDQLGLNVFRAVNTFDGVPTLIPKFTGYRHHGVEYWTFDDFSPSTHTIQCAVSGEDPTCSDSIPSTGINLAHAIYYGILAITPFC